MKTPGCSRDGCPGVVSKARPDYCTQACAVIDTEFDKLRSKILRAEREGKTIRAAGLTDAWWKLVTVSDTYSEVRALIDKTRMA